ncbi:hypothetical protein MOQ_005739 [Trypanosoma cruzi marinkellei]|uniref:Uncharacterized protein n=1 Tax=Trypanosoma cruzi marinkellei TaxID=85056 RepID=K2MXC7_TRYCR|nr:hypothetical protein MOQ_005739 [Trypanosoma cruzi marinkellei]
MSHFSREATKLLRAAEDALSGRRPAALSLPIEQQESWDRRDGVLNGRHGDSSVLELQRQLRVAMTEISNLRKELMAERESRSQTIVSLGRRWKEEVMVELHAADHQSRRAIAELEVNVLQRYKEEATARAVMQRQLDEALRSSKVRDRSQFEKQEYIQEQIDSLRERLEAAVAECGLIRIESTQQLEKERASLAQRLDVELLRYLDMRRDDQREREKLKQQLKADIAATGQHVRELVDEAWRTHAAALERTLREPIDIFAQKIARHEELVAGMDSKIHDCSTTCHAEVRLQTASLQERVGALESSSAVTASRVDRAERKADNAQEAVSRMDANLGVARDTAERAQAQAQRAMERAQRVEDTVQDRDARLTQIETHLGAAATSEKLRAEIESVRRAALRAESGVDALRQVCERDEQLAEQTRRVVDGYTDRIEGCEQLVHRLRATVETVEGRVPHLQQRLAALEETRESLVASNTRLDDAAVQIVQRVKKAEAAVKGVGERLEQSRRDTLSGLQSVNTRLEHANDMALRSETSSAAARAEVDRMDRRLCELESRAGRFAADSTALRAATEDHAKDVAALSSRLQQTIEWQEQRDARMDAAILAAETQNTTATEQMAGRLETKMQRDVRRLQSTFEDRVLALEASMETKVAPLEEAVAKLRTLRGGEETSQLLSRELRACRSKIESLEAALAAISDTVEQGHKEYVLLRDWNALRKTVASLESRLHATNAGTTLQQQTCEEFQVKLQQLEGEQRRQRQALHDLQASLSECREETCAANRSVAAVISLHAKGGGTTTRAVTGTGDKKQQGDFQTPLGNFSELRSSDPRMPTTLASAGGTEMKAPRTQPRTSITELLVKDDQNESPDAQAISSSRKGADVSRRASSSVVSMTTATPPPPLETRRLKSSAVDTTNRQQAMAWNDTTNSNSGDATPPAKVGVAHRESVFAATDFRSPAVTTPVDAAHTFGADDDNAEEAASDFDAEMKAAPMQPPHESSSSIFLPEEPSRRSRVLSFRQHSNSAESVSAADSSTGAANVTPVKDTAGTAEKEAPPLKPTNAWYDDWDASTESENVSSAKEGKKEESASAAAPYTGAEPSSHGDEIYYTPRKTFLAFVKEPSEEAAFVPRHGVATSASTSSGESRRKEATPVMPASEPKRFTSFDDTTSEDEERENEV